MDASIVQALHQWASSANWLSSLVIVLAQAGVFVLPLALVAAWFIETEASDRRRQAVVVGFARVAAGVHYPSDIIGSAILALAIDGLMWAALRRLVARINLQRWDAGLRGSPPGVRRR